MTLRTSRSFWTVVAALALGTGSAVAADDGNAGGPGELGMEVVEVIEKYEPTPITKDDYFRQVALSVHTALDNELDRMLAASVNSTFQSLSDKFESRGEVRVADADEMDRLITVAAATPAVPAARATM